MREPYQKYLDLGIMHFMAYPETIGGNGPILETVAKIALDEILRGVASDEGDRSPKRRLDAGSGLTACTNPRWCAMKLPRATKTIRKFLISKGPIRRSLKTDLLCLVYWDNGL